MKSAYLTLLVLGLLLSSCGPSGGGADVPVPQAKYPPDGSMMQWVDGSSLVGIQCNDHDGQPAHFMWLQRAEVSGYMYDLCAEAGACTPSREPLEPDAPAPLSTVGPQGATAYCRWIGGELLTESIIADALQYSDVESHLDLVTPVGGFRCSVGDSHVTGTADFTSNAAVGSPMCETSPLMNAPAPNSASVMQFDYETAGMYCQGGKGYATIEFALDDDDQLVGIQPQGQGTCEVVDGDRVVCFGEAGSPQRATVSIQCNDIPAEMQPACLPGYEPGPPSSAPADAYFSADWTIPPDVARTVCRQPTGGIADLGAVAQPVEIGALHLCPVGSYYESASSSCVEPFPRSPGCLAGFRFDEVAGCCRPEVASGRFPGCPPGQALSTETGTCVSDYLFSDAGMFVRIEIESELGACAGTATGQGGGAGGCPPPAEGCPVDTKWNPDKCGCY